VASNAKPEHNQAGPDTAGFIITPMAAAAALDNGIGKFVAPDRTVSSSVLAVDHAGSNASFFGGLVLLPGSETVLIEQSDWSEERNINPYAVFDKTPAMLQVTPNLGRRDQTGINFTPSKPGILQRCDGQVMASNWVISIELGNELGNDPARRNGLIFATGLRKSLRQLHATTCNTPFGRVNEEMGNSKRDYDIL
jgi:hypothetical protein